MNKLSGFVWENCERERAAEQQTLQGKPNPANTPVLRWKGCPGSLRMPVPAKPARSPLPLTLHLGSMLLMDPSSSSDGFGGIPPPSRSFMLLYTSHWPGARFTPNITAACLSPYFITSFQAKPIPHSFPPPITDTNPKHLRLLQLLPLCELVRSYFHTHTTTKTDWLKTTHYCVPPRLTLRYKPVSVK